MNGIKNYIITNLINRIKNYLEAIFEKKPRVQKLTAAFIDVTAKLKKINDQIQQTIYQYNEILKSQNVTNDVEWREHLEGELKDLFKARAELNVFFKATNQAILTLKLDSKINEKVLNFPSKAKTLNEYLKRIQEYKGEKFKLPLSFVNNLLKSPALLAKSEKPKEGLIQLKDGPSIQLPHQVYIDFPRLHKLTINGQTFQTSSESIEETCNSLYKQADKNIDLFNHLLLLFTQATCSLMAINNITHFNHPKFAAFQVMHNEVDIEIFAGSSDATVSYTMVSNVLSLETVEDLTEYTKSTTRLTVNKEELAHGHVKNGSAVELHSAFKPYEEALSHQFKY